MRDVARFNRNIWLSFLFCLWWNIKFITNTTAGSGITQIRLSPPCRLQPSFHSRANLWLSIVWPETVAQNRNEEKSMCDCALCSSSCIPTANGNGKHVYAIRIFYSSINTKPNEKAFAIYLWILQSRRKSKFMSQRETRNRQKTNNDNNK